MHCMAYIAAAHGVRGEVYLKFCDGLTSATLGALLKQKKITLYQSHYSSSTSSTDVVEAASVRKGRPDVAQVFLLDKMRPHKKGWLLKLEGVGTRDQSEALIGWQWRVEKMLGLPDLQSYQLLNKKEQSLGFIEQVSANKDCVWLNIKNDEKKFLVPFVNSLVLHQDKQQKKIYMDLPQGLDEL